MRDVYSFCNALHLHTEENRHDAQIKPYGVFRKQEVKTLINKIIEEKHSSSVGLHTITIGGDILLTARILKSYAK